LNAVRIELRAEEIALVLRSESRAAITRQSGGSDAGEFRHDRHEVAGALELADRRVGLRIDATFYEVQQGIALAVFGSLK
jgi:hypothetical protein